MADIAHAGNFHRLGVLAKSGEVSLEKYPKVMVWIERVESRESYEASVWVTICLRGFRSCEARFLGFCNANSWSAEPQGLPLRASPRQSEKRKRA